MVLQCAEVVGILDTVLDFTIQWAFDRHSFGRPLAPTKRSNTDSPI